MPERVRTTLLHELGHAYSSDETRLHEPGVSCGVAEAPRTACFQSGPPFSRTMSHRDLADVSAPAGTAAGGGLLRPEVAEQPTTASLGTPR